MREAYDGAPNRLITLTVRAQADNRQADRARALVRAWRDIRAAYLRQHGKHALEFLAVFERTKRGEPHLHILCRSGYIRQRWLSDQMNRQIGAPIVDIRAVRGRRHAARYVAKYISKGLGLFSGCKRYWRSLRYLQPADSTPSVPGEPEPPPWRVVKERWEELAVQLAPANWSIAWGRAQAVVHFPRPP